jgi:hypothetical protein
MDFRSMDYHGAKKMPRHTHQHKQAYVVV